MVRNLFYRSGFSFFGSIIGKVFSTLAFILVARVLIPFEFGQLSFLITVLTLVTILSDFGLNQWYQKHASQLTGTESLNRVISARIITLVISALGTCIFLVLSQLFSPVLSFLLVLSLLPEALLSVLDGFYLQQKKVRQIAFKSSSKVIILLLGYLVLGSNLSLETSFSFLFLGSCATAIWFVPWNLLSSFSFSYKNGRATLRESRNFALLALTSLFYARGDALIVQYSLGSTSLGLYSAAYRYLESLSMLPFSLSQNLFSSASQEHGLSLRNLGKIFLVMILAGSVGAITTYILANFLIVTVLGVNYSEAVPVLKIFSLTVFLFFLNSPLSTVVQGSAYLKQFLPFGILNTVLNLVLNAFFIPLYGIQGAAVVMVLSEVTGLCINLLFTAKIYHLKHSFLLKKLYEN